jgi:hypothetical protein
MLRAFAGAELERRPHQRPSYWPQQGYPVAMADDLLRPKPEPQQQAGSVISLTDRDQERRHEAARRLAERHNAALRPQAPEDAA